MDFLFLIYSVMALIFLSTLMGLIFAGGSVLEYWRDHDRGMTQVTPRATTRGTATRL
jgi:hypothetical protein